MSLIDLMAKIKRRLPPVKLPTKAKQGILTGVLSLLYFTLITPLAFSRRGRGVEKRFGKGLRQPRGWQPDLQDTADRGIYGGMK